MASELARVRVPYREFRVFSLAAKLTASPKMPYFMRFLEPMFPAKVLPVWMPTRHFTEISLPPCTVIVGSPPITLWISSAEAMVAYTWCFRKFGVLNTARTSSPMNSKRVPRRSSMTSAILPSTRESKDSTSCGVRSLQASSKSWMSQKRMLTSHFATPMVASMPALKSRCTTHGGTYMDQDRMALRMDTKASFNCFSSWTSRFGLHKSGGMSLSTFRISREVIATMSSANDLIGWTSMAVNFWIFTFSTTTKKPTTMTKNSIVRNPKRWFWLATRDRSTKDRLVVSPLLHHTSVRGQHACSTSEPRRCRSRTMASALAKGSSCAAGTPLGKQRPSLKYVYPSRKRSNTWCRAV
mmetsp:Transcript_106673/g.296904  ORF Transcript_106673/g.296904 Transcript_106673/m.296904 type:complete len:354 (+) Transcript_106673:791-1852(+)